MARLTGRNPRVAELKMLCWVSLKKQKADLQGLIFKDISKNHCQCHFWRWDKQRCMYICIYVCMMYVSTYIYTHVVCVWQRLHTHICYLYPQRGPRSNDILVAMSTSSTQTLISQESFWRTPIGQVWDNLNTKINNNEV